MATVIDALVVTLGMDSSNFQRNSKDASRSLDQFSDKAQSDAKNVQRATRQMTQGFRAIRNELVGMLAFSVGGYGLGSLVANTIGDQAQIGRIATELRMSARELDAWGGAVATVGGKAEDAQQALRAMQSELTQYQLGVGGDQTVRMLRSVDISAFETNAQGETEIRDVGNIMREINQKWQTLSPEFKRFFSQESGWSEAWYNLMRLRPGEMGSRYDQAYQASNVTPESVESAKEAQVAFSQLAKEINGVWQTIFVSMTPAMSELNETMGEFGDWLNENRGEVEQFFTGMVEGGESLAGVLSEFNDATDGTVGKITALAAALGLLGAAASVPGRGKKGGALGLLGASTAGGYWLGNYLNEEYIEGSGFEGEIGKYVAKWLDFWGFSDEASRALKASGDENAFNMRDIRGALGGGSGGASGDEEQMIAWFMGNGWTRAQAVGIVSNLKAESSLNPKAVGDGGKAYGLAQWHPDRQRNFQRWSGKPIRESSLEEQMAFVNYEMRFGQEKAAGRALRGAQTAEEAAAIVSRRYERPANGEFQAQRRAVEAGAMYRGTAGLTPLGATSRPGMRDGAGGNVSNSSETHVGSVNVYTTDAYADGIVKGIREEFERNQLINSSTTGMR